MEGPEKGHRISLFYVARRLLSLSPAVREARRRFLAGLEKESFRFANVADNDTT
jgi:hypothetical protein